MATSGSIDFGMNRNEIILDACEEIGVAIDGEALEPEVEGVANRVLNRMTKAFIAHGMQLWKRDSLTVTLVDSQVSYTFGPSGGAGSIRPLRILECNRVDSDNISTTMTMMTLDEYQSLSSKTTTGTPVNFYYNPTLPDGTLKVWPAPTATVASEYTLDIVYQSPLEDFDNSTDDPDFPVEWLEALVYGLARRLARKYGSLSNYEMEDLKQQAKESLDLALSWDREDGSIYFQPNMRGYRGR